MKNFTIQTWLFGAVLILFYVCAGNAFNLEARDPIVKIGEVGSYFGYSVAEHMEETESKVQKNW